MSDEGMLDFYRTQGGRKFFDSTLPRIATALEDIAAALKAQQARAPVMVRFCAARNCDVPVPLGARYCGDHEERKG